MKTFVKILSIVLVSAVFLQAAPAPFAANVGYFSDTYVPNINTFVALTDAGHKFARSGNYLHVVYASSSGTTRNIYYVRSADNGASWSSPVPIASRSNTSYALDPSVAVNGSNVYIVYSASATGGAAGASLYLIKDANNGANILTGGGNQGSAIYSVSGNNLYFDTDIVLTNSGIGIAATYGPLREMQFFYSSDYTNFYKDTFNFNTSSEYGINPSLATDGANIYLAFDAFATPPNGSVKLYKRSNGSWSTFATIVSSGGIAQHPGLVYNTADSLVHVAYVHGGAGSLSVGYRAYNTGGNLSSTKESLASAANDIRSPQIGFSGYDSRIAVIQYITNSGGGDTRVGQVSRKSAGDWSSEIIVPDTGKAIYLHMLPEVTADQPYMLWHSSAAVGGGTDSVYFNRAADAISPYQPAAPGINWQDKGINSADTQAVSASAVAPPGGGAVYYDWTGSRVAIADTTWTASLTDPKSNVADRQTVSAQTMARDAAGNQSLYGPAASVVLGDRTPPANGSVVIPAVYTSGAQRYTAGHNVTLALSASDPDSGVTTVNLGNTSPPGSAYAYSTARAWSLAPGDGLRTVYARYYDAAGNYRDVSATINVDTTPPARTTTSGSQSSAQSAPVLVTWNAAADVPSGSVASGVAGYYVYWGSLNNGTTSTGLQTAASISGLAPMSAPGTNYLRVQTVDNAGNKSDWQTVLTYTYTATVSGSIVINGAAAPGPTYTNTPTVSLTLIYSNSQITRMRFHNDNSSWSTFESVASAKPNWRLSSGDGQKLVYVEYSDNNATATGSAYDEIYLDTLSPNMTNTGQFTATTNRQAAAQGGYTLTAADNLNPTYASGVDGYNVYWGKSSSGVDNVYYQNYATYANVAGQLLANDGAGVYYLRARPKDRAGNLGPWATVLTYQYDPVPPTGAVSLLSNVNNTQVNLNLTASDNDLVVSYYAANSFVDINSQPDSVWKTWNGNGSYAHTLTAGGSGSRTVYVWYKDRAGNVSTQAYTAGTNYINPSGKSGSVLIKGDKGDDRYTTTVNVTLNLTYDSTAVDMLIWNEGVPSSSSQWQPLKTVLSGHILPPGDGAKTVHVAYRDAAGTRWEASDTIVLDTQPPYNGQVLINNDSQYANTRNVVLNITADGNPYEMQITNNESGSPPDWSSAGWVSYNQYYSWVLSGSGVEVNVTKTVQVRFRDEASNISVYCADSIILNTSDLNGSLLINPGQPPYTNTRNVLLTPIAPSADWMLLSNKPDFSDKWDAGRNDWQWVSYDAKVDPWDLFAPGDPVADGVRYVYAVFQNSAGTLSPTVNAAVTVDMTPPYGPGPGAPGGPNPHDPQNPGLSHGCMVIINGGAESSIMNMVELALYALDANQMLISNYADFRDVNDNNWRPYVSVVQDWPLYPVSDGPHTVWVKFRDIAGNISLAADSITLNMGGSYYFHFIEPDGLNDVASDNFTISWLDNYEGDPGAEILLYWVRSADGVTGAVLDIASGLPASGILVSDNINGVIWDTSGLASGYYELMAVVSGNRGTFSAPADHAVLVVHADYSGPTRPDVPSVPLPVNPPSALVIEPDALPDLPLNGLFTIYWRDAFDPLDSAARVSLYYNTAPTRNADGSYGVLIAGDISPNGTTNGASLWNNFYNWQVQGVPPGDYYICAVISSNPYENYDYSSGVVHIAHETTPGNGGTGEGIWSYPNPFSPITRGEEANIAYNVKQSGWTRVYVVNIRGEKIWQIINYAYADKENIVIWDGRTAHGNTAGNGIYILLLTDERKKILARGRLTLLD